MKHPLILLLICNAIIFSASCERVVTSTPSGLATELAQDIGTKAEAPLLNTVWRCGTDSDYDLFLWFWSDSKVSFFFGTTEDNEIQRWSAFYGSGLPVYSSPENGGKERDCGGAVYSIQGNTVNTSIKYPSFGQEQSINAVELGKVTRDYIMTFGDLRFNYQGSGTRELATQMWLSIFADVKPWE